MLADFGVEGQKKLSSASVLVIGVGGLGCPLLQYLVSMGIGRIAMVDGDKVTESNLHRQILFETKDIGLNKVDAAIEKLSQLNPQVVIETFPYYIDQSSCTYLIPEYDVVVDCTDNFTTRYMINDACVLFGKPLIFGAVSRYEGQVAAFNINRDGYLSANYRDLHPDIPYVGEVLNCADAGILGVMSGIIGSLQAAEVVKYLCSIDDLLINKMLYYNMKSQSIFTLEYESMHCTKFPKSIEEFMNYEFSEVCDDIDIQELTIEEYLADASSFEVIDVRTVQELPKWSFSNYHHIELSHLKLRLNDIPQGKVLFICQVGIRSAEAARILARYHNDKSRFYNLKGGIQKVSHLIDSLISK
jgi:adenylyltransferase/sulfurtransferase